MNVTLIDYTGRGSSDPARDAANVLVYAKNTRLEQGDESRAKVAAMSGAEISEELDYIAKTIKSAWEFVDYTFEITGVTRAFTHQFVRTRTASYAQQSQRSVALKDIQIRKPETVIGAEREVAWDRAVKAIKDGYARLLEAGVPTEDARGLLPTNVLTNIVAKMNLRTLASLAGKRINPRAQGEYTEVVVGMTDAVLSVHPWAKPFLFPDKASTPELSKILKDALGSSTPFSKPHINAALKELDALKGTWD